MPDTEPDLPRARTEDVDQCHYRALRRASCRLLRLYEGHFTALDLRQIEFSMMAEIFKNGSMTLREISRDFMLDRSSLRYQLEPLLRRGFIAFGTDARDRRKRRVTLTPDGARVLDKAHPLWLQAQDRFESVLGADRADTLRAALKIVGSPAFEAAFHAPLN